MQAKSKVLAMLFVLLAMALLPGTALATVVDGVAVDGTVPAQALGNSQDTRQPIVLGQIKFDDAPAQCAFMLSNPLRNEYQARGVVFAGNAPLNGGAILDQCGIFGVSGYSPPNFLAFSSVGPMANGGIPNGPERMLFTTPVSSVEMKIGSSDSRFQSISATLMAYDAVHVLEASATAQLSSAMQIMNVSAHGIVEVDVDVSCSYCESWVIDDLAFSTNPTPTRLTTWGGLKSIYR